MTRDKNVDKHQTCQFLSYPCSKFARPAKEKRVSAGSKTASELDGKQCMTLWTLVNILSSYLMQYLELRPTTGQKSSHFLLETRIVVSCHKLIMEREQVPLFVAVPSFEITVEPAATFCLCAGWYSNPFTEDHANPPHGLLDQSACKKWQQAIRKHLCCWSDEGAYCAAVHIRSTSNVASCNKVSVSTSSVHKPYFEFAS